MHTAIRFTAYCDLFLSAFPSSANVALKFFEVLIAVASVAKIGEKAK